MCSSDCLVFSFFLSFFGFVCGCVFFVPSSVHPCNEFVDLVLAVAVVAALIEVVAKLVEALLGT